MLFILTFLARSIDLELSATANLSYAYRRGGTYLEWTNIKDQDIYYKLYQKSKDSNGVWSDWKQCSTYNKGSKIKVLNIYPSQFDGTNGTKAINASIYETYKVYFKFTNETQERELPKSASLKLWMEGGTLIENGVKTKIEGFGIDPDTNLQIIFVDIISINDFETNITVDKSFIYNYDVIFFGTWDGSAGYSIKRITAQNVIYEYLKKGYSVFAGHDCLTRIFVENHQATGLLALRNYFGIKLDYLDYNYGTNYTTFVSDEISIQRKGLLTNYPYEIGDIGRILKVPRTHTYYHAATGDVWISLNNEGVHEDKNGLKHNFYLTTKDNTAVIQTGHSNCEASEDERKIIANTIYYLKQRTYDNYTEDHSSQDITPPKITDIKYDLDKLKVKFNAEDFGSDYKFLVEAHSLINDKIFTRSNEVDVNVKTGIDHYKYVITSEKEVSYKDLIYKTLETTIPITIEDIQNEKYFHVAAIDRAGNIGDISTIKLQDKIKLTVKYEDDCVILNWTGFNETQNIYYTVYSSSDDGTNWKPISSFDYNTTQDIKVLNVYPQKLNNTIGSDIPNVTYMYADGTNQTTYLSAALKVWMEGGSYEYSGENYTFEPYGLNPYTGKQIIHVTPKVTKEFDEMTLDEMKEYDVIFFGTWDSNGGQFISNESVQRVSEYIDLGYGVLLGHDVVGSSYGREIGLGQIADKFGILLGTTDCDLSSCSNGDLPYKWRYYSNETKVTKSGFLTQFPYQLDQNSNFSIPLTHTCENAAFGDVWMELGSELSPNYESNFSAPINYEWNLPGYSEPRHGNPYYYLTTYRNTAMIQTGHSGCGSTEVERKILANTIYYLFQRTSYQFSYDNSAKDTKAPSKPTITRIEGERSVTISAEDPEVKYLYKVIGITFDGNHEYQSDDIEFYFPTGISEYYYVVDNNSDTVISSDTANLQKTSENEIKDIINENVYVHVAAIDKTGNIGETEHYFIREDPTNTYSQSDTYSQSNSFTKMNSFVQTSSFATSNTFSLFSKFTDSLLSGVTLTHSFIISYILSYTKSLTIYNSYLTSFIITNINSSFTYIPTLLILYDYTVIIYSKYFKYYSDFYIIFENFETKVEDKTYVYIIVGVLIAVIIISLLIILLIRMRNKKHENKEESNDDIEKVMETNNFSIDYLNNINEEDPFAKRFQRR